MPQAWVTQNRNPTTRQANLHSSLPLETRMELLDFREEFRDI